MSDRRVFTITARAGEQLPDHGPDDTAEGYEISVFRWAVDELTEEDARAVVATYRTGDPLARTFETMRAMLLRVFPDAEVRHV